MKKEVYVFSILILFVVSAINLISAVDIKLSKASYHPQETLQVEITGNFIDNLILENVLIYKQGIPRSTPVISDLTKQGEIYYFYAILPNQEGNFSLKIENAKYTESGTEKTTAIIKEFIIKKTNESVLQINPGFVKTSSDFSIKVRALNKNQEVSATFNTKTQNISIVEDTEKTLSFSVANLSGKYSLKINGYTIPVFVIEKVIINNTIINQTNQTNINQTNQTINGTKINVINKTEEEIKALYCADFGKECGDNEQCDVETKPSLDSGSCCPSPGTCIAKKAKSYTWIGVLIIVIVLVAVAYLYFKGKNKRPPSSEEILKKRSDKFEDRMSGDDERREVSGKLDTV